MYLGPKLFEFTLVAGVGVYDAVALVERRGANGVVGRGGGVYVEGGFGLGVDDPSTSADNSIRSVSACPLCKIVMI